MFTASAAAMLASTSALGVRTVIGPNAVLSTGFNLDGGTPFAPNDDLVLGGLYNFTADVSMGSLNIGANNNAVMTVPANTAINLGNVTSNGAEDGLSVNVPNDGASLTLTGNNYYINNMNFNGTASTLSIASTVLAPANSTIFFAEDTIITGLQGQNNLTIVVNTEFVVKDPAWTKANAINIGNLVNSRYNLVTDTSDIVLYPGGPPEVVDAQPIANINWSGPNSLYVVTNESANQAKFIATVPLVPAQDLWGQLGVHVAADSREIALNAGSGNGTGATKRLNIFSTDGIANETGQSLNENPVTVTGTIFAQTIQIGNQYEILNPGVDPDYGVDWTTAIDTGVKGVVQFTHNSLTRFQDDVISNIDFNGKAAQVTIGAGADVGGATGGNIDNTVAGGANILNFAGNSTVSGDIGATNPINKLNVQGNNTTAVDIGGDVTVNEFNFTTNGVASVGGTLVASTGVDYNNAPARLQFNGAVGINPYTFASPVLQANNGILDVYTNLLATNASIGTLATINIGNVVGPVDGEFTVTVPGNFTLGSAVNIATAGSQLIIAPGAAQTVTFSNNVAGPGIVNLIGNGVNLLTVQGDANAATLGTAGAKLAQLNIQGQVTALGGVGTALNVSNTNQLNLLAGSTFTDNSLTSVGIAKINIGDGNGLATYILDTINGDIPANAPLNTGGMTFVNAASVLQLQSSTAVDSSITLNGDLNPGGAGGATGTGIVKINAINANETLTIDGVGFNLGTVGVGGNLLNSMTFSGAGNITVVPTINTANAILTGITGDLILNNVNAPINFTTITNLTVSDVTGAINLGIMPEY